MLNCYYKRNFIGIGTVLRLIGNDDKTRGIIAVIVNIGRKQPEALQPGSLFACNGCFMKAAAFFNGFCAFRRAVIRN